MGRIGQFDTDSGALQRRIRAHEESGKNDLNAWIFGHLGVKPGMRVLDLGCGTGSQSLIAAEAVGPEGRVVCFDKSRESLDTLASTARDKGLSARLRLVEGDLDDLGKLLAGEGPFDRVLASYSLYYTRRAEALVAEIARRMPAAGVFFFCGPSPDNNDELKRFHHALSGTPSKLIEAAEFMTVKGPRACREHFTAVETFAFENPLDFPTAEKLLEYWRSYNLYDASLEDQFSRATAEHFATHAVFTTVKRVTGVRALK